MSCCQVFLAGRGIARGFPGTLTERARILRFNHLALHAVFSVITSLTLWRGVGYKSPGLWTYGV